MNVKSFFTSRSVRSMADSFPPARIDTTRGRGEARRSGSREETKRRRV